MIAVGATVGNYVVQQKIGEGAMGIVFLAIHPSIGKRVALKVIHPELATNEEMLGRFFNEARAVTQIGHHHIVSVQDFGQTPDGDSFIVMELLEGTNLGDLLRDGQPLPLERTLKLGRQIADGIAAAHQRGIIHRDLKPDNIILVERAGDPDFVKILDFGLAKLTGPTMMGHKTKTGSLLGTPHYMAPEQAEGKKIDARVDVYALGCMLFQMLTGRVPFPGDGFGEVLVKQLREPPPLPSRLNPRVPPSVEKIVLHALAKKADFRFQSMEAFREALDNPARFEMSMEAAAAQRATVSRPVAAPLVPAAVAPAPRAVALKLPEDAPTMQANAPPEVVAAMMRAAPTAVGQLPDASLDQVPRRRLPLLVAGATGLLACVAVGALLLVGGSPPSLKVLSTPAGATVSHDGVALGKTPLTLPVTKGTAALELTLDLDGFVEAHRTVRVGEEREVSVRLLPRPTPPPAPPPPAPPPAAVQAPEPVAPPPPRRPPPVKRAKKPAPRKSDDQLLLEPSF